MFHVYVIKSIKHDWYYVGSTGDLQNRLDQHNAGQVHSTKFRLPYILFYTETYSAASEARQREKKIKKDRILKESIIRNTAPSSIG